jgi:hypothetical protein
VVLWSRELPVVLTVFIDEYWQARRRQNGGKIKQKCGDGKIKRQKNEL